jgi:hypothetical protein
MEDEKVRWVAMAGLRGYMPNVCETFHYRADAIRFLSEMHELHWHRTGAVTELRETGFAEIDLHTFGNEYISVQRAED